MPETQFLPGILYSQNAGEIPDLEGSIVTGRKWGAYRALLGIELKALKNETVLNFGSGGSNLAEKLKTEDVRIVELDLKYDPLGTSDNPFMDFALSYAQVLLENPHVSEKLKRQLLHFKRKHGKTEGRDFAQGNGRDLPFGDGVFDHVLALWSTYQIPKDARATIYKELMRVGNILHIGPIFKNEYLVIRKLAVEFGYEIVTCRPFPESGRTPFMFSSKMDYDDYLQQNTEAVRIQEPIRDEAEIVTRFGAKYARGKGGSTIVLRKKTNEEA